MEDKIIELFLPEQLKDEPVIYDIIKKFDIHVKIIEASFSCENGWAILHIEGGKQEMENLMNYLSEKGINVEER